MHSKERVVTHLYLCMNATATKTCCIVLQAPDVMRSCSMALQLLSVAIGSYLGGGLVAAVQAITSSTGHPWLPRDLNHGHMDYFLLLTGGLMTLNTIVFVWVAIKYEYKAVEHRGVLKAPTADEQAAAAVAGRGPSPAFMLPPPSGTAIAIDAARRSQYHYRGSGEEGADVYSRSLAYFPQSPALPAPFR
eukprot:jgi/Chrzof1/3451/Cz12g26030.t1